MKKELFYPVKPMFVNQVFGANANAYYAQAGLKGHAGIDFMAKHGQKIYASHDGICYPEIDSHGGNGVVLKSLDKSYQSIYWHLIDDDAVVHTGQTVKAGDLLGYADSTGQSTGDHLHFQVTPLINTDFGNGYNGAIDPQPFFNGKYAEEINNPVPPVAKFKFTKTLKNGSWNADVKQLQLVLGSQTLYNGAIDGIFGKMTQSSVIAFQTLHGLIPDGICGILTRNELNKLL